MTSFKRTQRKYVQKALTPLYVKTLDQTACVTACRMRKSVMTRW